MRIGHHKKSYILALSLLISIGAAVTVEAKTMEVKTSWAVGPVEIDGSLAEWKEMPTTFFEEERLILGISNDADNLYLFLRTDDARLIRTIRMTGIKLWIDSKAKKKKDMSFHYRGGPTMVEIKEAGIIDTSQFGKRMNDENFQRRMEMSREAGDNIILTDKELELEESIPVDGSRGPAVRYGFEHGFCIYEISIPLEEHKIDYYGVNSGPGQNISVGIRWGGQPDRQMGTGAPSGGMGSGGRGGMGGGRGGSDRMQPPDKKEFWIKTELATSVPGKK